MTTQQKGLDMYNMVGLCSKRIMNECALFALRNLVDASDQQVQKIQRSLIKWLWHIVGVRSKKRAGIVLHSGSEANEIALLLARRRTGKDIVITSNISHHSIRAACDKLKMRYIVLDVDPKLRFKVPSGALRRTLVKYHERVALVNITHGTTKLGTSEDFEFSEQIASMCRTEGIWIHVDAAYGGTIMNLIGCVDRKWQKSSLMRSMTIDPHKFVGVLGCGVLLLNDRRDRRLVGPEVPYFSGHTTALGTTRSAFPAATALGMLDELGFAGLKRLAQECHTRAQWVAQRLKKKDIPLLSNIQSGVVPIACSTRKKRDQLQDRLLTLGFRVSPIEIIGRDYVLYGVRIVVTPKVEMSVKNLQKFVQLFPDTSQAFSSSQEH